MIPTIFTISATATAAFDDFDPTETESLAESVNAKTTEDTRRESTMIVSTSYDDSPDFSPDILLPVRQQRETFLT